MFKSGYRPIILFSDLAENSRDVNSPMPFSVSLAFTLVVIVKKTNKNY